MRGGARVARRRSARSARDGRLEVDGGTDARGHRVQDVDGISNVEALSQPAGHRGSRVNVEPVCVVPRQQCVDGSLGHRGAFRDFR